MVLRTPTVHGVGNLEGKDIHQKWDTMPSVEETLVSMGIAKPSEPNHECPLIEPGSLLAMSSQDYTTLFEKVLNWYGYLSEQVAYAKAMVLQSGNEMTYVETATKKSMLEAPGKKPTAEAMNNKIESDPHYVDLKLIHQKWTQLKLLLEGRLSTVEANLKTVSRHIEIRKLEREGSRMGSNMPGRGHLPRPGVHGGERFGRQPGEGT